MDKNFLSKVDQAQKAKIAVAYLMKNKEDRPAGLEKLFSKLEKYELSMREIMNAINQTKKSLEELDQKGDQMLGSIESIAELISEELPVEKVNEWCEKYELPDGIPANIQMAGKAPMKKVGSVDVAGSTSKLAEAQMGSEPALAS
jgi:chromosome segregation ATPase